MDALRNEPAAQSRVEASGDERKRSPTTSAQIGPAVTWKGTLVGRGTIHIIGNFEGEVRTAGCVIVGPHGYVDGKVIANSLLCHGRVRGHVSAKQKVEVRASAVITGSVTTPALSIEQGGLLIADVEMRKAHAPQDAL